MCTNLDVGIKVRFRQWRWRVFGPSIITCMRRVGRTTARWSSETLSHGSRVAFESRRETTLSETSSEFCFNNDSNAFEFDGSSKNLKFSGCVIPCWIERQEVAWNESFGASLHVLTRPPQTVFTQRQLNLIHEVVRVPRCDSAFTRLSTQHPELLAGDERKLVLPLGLMVKCGVDLELEKFSVNDSLQ